jgi:hypothetical protein
MVAPTPQATARPVRARSAHNVLKGWDDAGMDAVLAGGVFGVVGVLLGAGLNEWSARRGRHEVHLEQQETERHARELVVAERLDEALVNAQKAIESSPTDTLDSALRSAHVVWESAWVAYSPRIRQRELLLRYWAIGSILSEYALNKDSLEPAARRIVGRANRQRSFSTRALHAWWRVATADGIS